jgi:hypothetical protein
MLVRSPDSGARPLSPHGDMSSCTNVLCPSRAACWRFMKPASEPWQSYSAYSVPAGGDRCDNYIPILSA